MRAWQGIVHAWQTKREGRAEILQIAKPLKMGRLFLAPRRRGLVGLGWRGAHEWHEERSCLNSGWGVTCPQPVVCAELLRCMRA